MGLGIFLGILISYSILITFLFIIIGLECYDQDDKRKRKIADLNFKLMVVEMEKNELQKTKENL